MLRRSLTSQPDEGLRIRLLFRVEAQQLHRRPGTSRHTVWSPARSGDPCGPALSSTNRNRPDQRKGNIASRFRHRYVPLLRLRAHDGEAYAKRLTEAGVPATFSLQPGQIHTSPGLTKLFPAARAWCHEVITALRKAHQHPIDATHLTARPSAVDNGST
jgi:acetyl esterase/lipase